MAAFVFFVLSYEYLLSASDFVFFKTRDKKLREFVTDIKKFDKIKEMTDGKRGHEEINYEHYYFDIKELYGTPDSTDYQYNRLLEKLNIDEAIHKKFCENLFEIGCYEFSYNDDGTICFTIDSFLQHANGIMYSEIGEPQGSRGITKMWKKVANKWYLWGS
ncbi:MAG: hypothetical protein K1X86_09020 [Ignavibacteria bacterium]|nr:hypothetical protein [Ignavibacteria bacterium]